MGNLDLYNSFRHVPPDALKTIAAGRLKGKSDINPMWRLKALTEQFGPCGIGWKYTIDRRWLEPAPNGEVAAFVEISMFIKYDGQWSDGIPGTGGSSFVANEKSGPYMSDECFKMALTDAISVACKALGVAADVYWEKDKTKYSGGAAPVICPTCQKQVKPAKGSSGAVLPPNEVLAQLGCCSTCYKAKNNG